MSANYMRVIVTHRHGVMSVKQSTREFECELVDSVPEREILMEAGEHIDHLLAMNYDFSVRFSTPTTRTESDAINNILFAAAGYVKEPTP